MHSQNKRLCIFGDSHFACVKYAMTQAKVDTTGVDVEFWGNIGKQFRSLTWRNDQIEPLDRYTGRRFAASNSAGRTKLNAADFDVILFMGCRIDVHRLIPELLHRKKTSDSQISSGVTQRYISDFLNRLPPYHFAKNFAAQNKAQIVSAPISFNTDGFSDQISETFPLALHAIEDDRRQVWDAVEKVMAADGIIFLPQPEETIINGCYTDPAYAAKNYLSREDRTHKNLEYGALILNLIARMVRAT